jgi:hypothetical protein
LQQGRFCHGVSIVSTSVVDENERINMSKKRWSVIAALVAVMALAGTGAAIAGGYGVSDGSVSSQDAGEQESASEAAEDPAEGPDVAITGTDLETASAAAIAHLGEGTVTATEVGDEESYYEVEVRVDDGSEVDVQLDEEFNFVGID